MWQPIETAPKDGTDVLLWQPCRFPGPGSAIIGSFRTDQNDEEGDPLWLENDYDDWSTGYASTPAHPTHWMPLPMPPIEAGTGETGTGSIHESGIRPDV